MDRVPDYESVGCAFESRMAHSLNPLQSPIVRDFFVWVSRSEQGVKLNLKYIITSAVSAFRRIDTSGIKGKNRPIFPTN